MPSVLFVCTANMCRSPMAMVLFRRRLEQAGMTSGWRVESAGTWAREGDPAASGAQHAISEQELDLSEHSSRCVTAELLRSFGLILTMSRSHQEALQIEFRDVAKRVHMLTAMAGIAFDIPDPIGGPLKGFIESAREIDTILAGGFDKIVQLATEHEAQTLGASS